MQKVSLKKLSVLGLVLMAASAVTAAILPKSNDLRQSNSADNGTLRQDSGIGASNPNAGLLSCVTDLGPVGDVSRSCHLTADSSLDTGNSDVATVNRTVGNTSLSNGIATADTTSVIN